MVLYSWLASISDASDVKGSETLERNRGAASPVGAVSPRHIAALRPARHDLDFGNSHPFVSLIVEIVGPGLGPYLHDTLEVSSLRASTAQNAQYKVTCAELCGIILFRESRLRISQEAPERLVN